MNKEGRRLPFFIAYLFKLLLRPRNRPLRLHLRPVRLVLENKAG